MTALTRKPILGLIAAALLAASVAPAPAEAQRGRGGGGGGDRGDRGDNRGGDRDRGDRDRGDRDRGNNNWNGNNRNDWYRDRDRRDNDWSLSFSFGTPYYRSYNRYNDYNSYRYTTPSWSNRWGLRPYDCRVDYQFDYWYGRPADIEVRRCADAYGNVYIVQGSQRLWRYR